MGPMQFEAGFLRHEVAKALDVRPLSAANAPPVLIDHAHSAPQVTLIPRGQARGLTWFTPGEDPTLISKSQIFARIVSALGGRAAEQVIFGDPEVTTGASGDLQQVRACISRNHSGCVVAMAHRQPADMFRTWESLAALPVACFRSTVLLK